MGDLTLVLSPRRGYFGFPTGGIIKISGTMPRQDFTRWARWAKKPEKPAISKYLQDAVAAHKDSHIVITVDLQDLIDPTGARAKLQRSGVMPSDAGVDSVVNVLSGARGMIVTAHIDDRTKTHLLIEFGIPMSDFIPVIQRLWPKALDAAGPPDPWTEVSRRKGQREGDRLLREAGRYVTSPTPANRRGAGRWPGTRKYIANQDAEAIGRAGSLFAPLPYRQLRPRRSEGAKGAPRERTTSSPRRSSTPMRPGSRSCH